MRAAIVAHLDEGGAGLSPAAREAVALLRDAATSAARTCSNRLGDGRKNNETTAPRMVILS